MEETKGHRQLRQWMARSSHTPKDVARVCGVSRQAVLLWLGKYRMPRAAAQLAMSHECGISLEAWLRADERRTVQAAQSRAKRSARREAAGDKRTDECGNSAE